MQMNRYILVALAAATVMAVPAAARHRPHRPVGPGRAEVAAALNRHGEAVTRVTGLSCAEYFDAGHRSARCRFTANYGPRRERHVATFQYFDGWRLLDDRPE